MQFKQLTDKISFVGTNFDLLTALGLVPLRILGREKVRILFLARVLLLAKAPDRLKVRVVQEMRSLEDAKPAIFRTVGSQVCDSLVELEAIVPARILVHI